MKLIYVNEIGEDYKGQKQYEFIFSESEEISVDSWFTIPSSSISESQSPDMMYIDMVGLLKDTDIELDLIQKSDYFGIIDAVDGIIAMAWEKYDADLEIDRIFFKFGERIESITKKLEERNYRLITEKIKTT
jgi:hypothetical protein